MEPRTCPICGTRFTPRDRGGRARYDRSECKIEARRRAYNTQRGRDPHAAPPLPATADKRIRQSLSGRPNRARDAYLTWAADGRTEISQAELIDQLGGTAKFLLPTLCWFNSSDAFLHFLCAAGVVFSIVLMAGFIPVISLVLLFVFYLSLTIAGQTFLSFQWDILLLETGFLAIFFAPMRWRTGGGRDAPVSRVGHFLLKLLLFKLMVMSGVVKLTSGDDSWGWVDHSLHWSALTALDYHYWSQPLPTISSAA
jgi:hypothetical protein